MKKDKYQTMIDNFISVPESVKLGLPSSSIYHTIKHGKIKVYTRGSIKLVLKNDILEMLEVNNSKKKNVI